MQMHKRDSNAPSERTWAHCAKQSCALLTRLWAHVTPWISMNVSFFFALSATLLIPLEAWLLLKIHRNITFAEMNELEYIIFVFIQKKIQYLINMTRENEFKHYFLSFILFPYKCLLKTYFN